MNKSDAIVLCIFISKSLTNMRHVHTSGDLGDLPGAPGTGSMIPKMFALRIWRDAEYRQPPELVRCESIGIESLLHRRLNRMDVS